MARFLVANFNDGSDEPVNKRRTDRDYTHGWRVRFRSRIDPDRTVIEQGFSGSELLARKQIDYWRSLAEDRFISGSIVPVDVELTGRDLAAWKAERDATDKAGSQGGGA